MRGAVLVSNALSALVRQLTSLVDDGLPPDDLVTLVQTAVSSALRDPDLLDPWYSIPPAGTDHGIYLLHGPPGAPFTVVAAVWHPGARTEVHDHGGGWAVDGLVRGRLSVTEYADPGLGAGSALIASARFEQTPGDVLGLVGEHQIHQVSNDCDEPAVSFHVNGFDLLSTPRRVFELANGSHTISRINKPYATPPKDLFGSRDMSPVG